MSPEATPLVTVPPGAPALDADLAEVGRTHCTWCGSADRETFRGERCHWHRCRQCGFWLSELLVDPQEYAEADYGTDYQMHYYGRSLQRKLRTSYHRFRQIEAMRPAKGAFLDVGCSYGTMLVAGADRGWQTAGFDIAPAMVEYGQREGRNVRLGSLTSIPFEDASFDVVHARHVLEHDVQTYRALQEIWRVTRPGGLLVVEVPDGECRRTMADPAKEVPHWSYLHMVTFTPSTLAGFMGRVGWVAEPERRATGGDLHFRWWDGWKHLRERRRWATYFITFWGKPADAA